MAVIKEEKTKNLLFVSSPWLCLAPVEDKMQLKGLWGTVCATSEQHPLTGSQTHILHPTDAPWSYHLCILCCEGSPGQYPTLVLQTPKPDKTTEQYLWTGTG